MGCWDSGKTAHKHKLLPLKRLSKNIAVVSRGRRYSCVLHGPSESSNNEMYEGIRMDEKSHRRRDEHTSTNHRSNMPCDHAASFEMTADECTVCVPASVEKAK